MANLDRTTEPQADYGASARWLNLLLGVWLFISAWIWPHTLAERTDAWIAGVLFVIVSAWALFAPSLRYVNTLLAIGLFISTLLIHHTNRGTLWNNCIVAVLVFLVSLIPSRHAALPGGGRPIHAT